MTYALREQSVEQAITGYTYVSYVLEDDVTHHMFSRQLKYLTKSFDRNVADVAIQEAVVAANRSPEPPPITVDAVVAKIAEVLSDTKLSDADKVAALDAYQKQVDPKASAADEAALADVAVP